MHRKMENEDQLCWPPAMAFRLRAETYPGDSGAIRQALAVGSTAPDMRCWGLDQIREGFPEEVKPGGILDRGRLGQRPRGGEGLLGRGVAWWEHGTVPQRVIHGPWIPENITGCFGDEPLIS